MNDFLKGKVIAQNQITPLQLQEMLLLFREYFLDVDAEAFYKDIRDKDAALLLFNENNQIKGFTTFKILNAVVDGNNIRAVYSGNTIIDQNYQGKTDMPSVWMKYMLNEKIKFPEITLYWFLISSGIKTFIMLPHYFKEYWPNPIKPIPQYISSIISSLAIQEFGEQYDPNTGVIVFKKNPQILKDQYATIPESLAKNPITSFFLQINPNYYKGEELACLAEISSDNFNEYATKKIN